MTVTVTGKQLLGTTRIIASKSVIHRLLICAALCKTPTVIEGVSYSQDIEATVACLRSSFADVVCESDRVMITPYETPRQNRMLDCGESGSTLRFLLPICAAVGGAAFTGRGRLSERPTTPLRPLLEQNGCQLSAEGQFPLVLDGKLRGNTFHIDGSLSSQFVSGLLMAAPLLGTPCHIHVQGKMTSYPYIALTIEALSHFGITVTKQDTTFTVTGTYVSPTRLAAEGDWSNAAFWMVGAAVSHSHDFRLQGLSTASVQGDKAIVDVLEQAGFSVYNTPEGLQMTDIGDRQAISLDAEAVPDMVPIAAVLATALPGQTKIYNAARLIYKESNRLQSVYEMLTALGGKVTMQEDGLVITGGPLNGGVVKGYNDHRIVMAAAVASLLCEDPVTITGAQAVQKSYPTFFEELEKRGMKVCHLSGEEN